MFHRATLKLICCASNIATLVEAEDSVTTFIAEECSVFHTGRLHRNSTAAPLLKRLFRGPILEYESSNVTLTVITRRFQRYLSS